MTDTTGSAAPRSASELLTYVTGLIASLPGGMMVAPTENMFEAGVDSLLATRVCQRISRTLGRRVPVEMILTNPRPTDLADALVAWDAEARAARGTPR